MTIVDTSGAVLLGAGRADRRHGRNSPWRSIVCRRHELSATAIASVMVVAVVTGHVIGVVAAHDRAVRLFRRALRRSGNCHCSSS